MNRTGTARFATVGLAAALLFAGCGPPPDAGAATGGTDCPVQVVEGFLPCIVSGEGGFNDRSFNQLAFEGMQDAARQLGIGTFPNVQSNSASDYIPNIQSLLQQSCSLITAVSFDLAPAVVSFATQNPDVHFLLVDDDAVGASADAGLDGVPQNIKPILYDTAQAAFLVGYLAAAYSSRPGGAAHVGTFGGMAFPAVTTFMDGFRQGVLYYNDVNNANVQFTGWDGANGSFTGAFQPDQTAQTMAQGLIDQGVDVLLPVGGPIYQSAVAAIQGAGRPVALIGVDADLFETDPSTQPYVLTSILKNSSATVEAVVVDAASGRWDPTPFIGTLENDGVGVAPFHNFDDEISPELRERIEELRQQIIDGTLVVDSYLN